MWEEEKERLAFLCLCGAKDRDRLLGRSPMGFEDFERFLYLADSLELPLAQRRLWQDYQACFADRYRALEGLAGEYGDPFLTEDLIARREEWEERFVRDCPLEEFREIVRQLLSQDPCPSCQDDAGRVYGMTYDGMEIRFSVSGGHLRVLAVEPNR